ncbi:MAG: A/G-specific adenine glycosylase [Thermoguttaceae bacterium]|nr:A/G-specific adenine glycosylase [Thermoguttaceae bacterium]
MQRTTKKKLDAETSVASAEALNVLSTFDFERARTALLRWFDANGRTFPWRSEPTPYRVWVSEIMLQQTTTQTVEGYFSRFLERFPNAAALAEADEATVLKYWEGLGYYRRARSLWAAALQIVERFGGDVPERFEDVLSLPGVGRYCAGAILSFGFDRRAPILEANTTRLHARLLGLRLETTTATAQKILWRAAEDWLPLESGKDRKPNVYRRLNGALTDLGRLVCSPTSPKCDDCPLTEFCESWRRDYQDVVPVLKKKTETVSRTDVAFWIERRDLFGDCGSGGKRCDGSTCSDVGPTDVLLIRRPENALWAGLWDFPRFEITNEAFRGALDFDGDVELCDRLQRFLEEEVGAPPFDRRPGAVVYTVKHAATRFKITLRFCRLDGAAPLSSSSRREKTLFDELESAATSQVALPPPRRSKVAKKTRTPKTPEAARVAAEVRWVSLAELDAYPLSSPGRKLARFVLKNRG